MISGSCDTLRIISHFPGRVRVRARKFFKKPAFIEDVAARFGREPGVLSVSGSAKTGSILIEYNPDEIQVDALIARFLEVSGLSLISDGEDHAHGTAVATTIRQALANADMNMFRAANGTFDLRTAVPGALLFGGITTLLLGRFTPPQWFDLVFWGYVTFNNLNIVSGPKSNGQ